MPIVAIQTGVSNSMMPAVKRQAAGHCHSATSQFIGLLNSGREFVAMIALRFVSVVVGQVWTNKYRSRIAIRFALKNHGDTEKAI